MSVRRETSWIMFGVKSKRGGLIMCRASITRFALLIVAVVNSVLTMLGYETISEDLVNDAIAVGSGAYFLYAGWKNNYLSKKGLKQKEILQANKLTK